MINFVKADGKSEYELLSRIKDRGAETGENVSRSVAEIIASVKKNGISAVREYTLKFDGKCPEDFEVPREEINDALTAADPVFVNALLTAQANIAEFHARQKTQSFIDAKPNGVILGQKVRGLKKVGIYVPGGTAAYPSTVLMNTVPAKIAGVEEIVMVTPPSKNGKANPDILTAAAIAGVDRIFLMGGAQAVAALAFGADPVPKVDKIVGPGNIFVATAKRQLYGTVDIDTIAGPSEILVMADSTADPVYVAADLLSQAEHDVLSSAILLTNDERLASETMRELKKQASVLPRKDIVAKSLADYSAVILCQSTEQMLSLANLIAPEHLEVMLENPLSYIGKIDNAGSVFLGKYSPEALGDYMAGPNHVLPTGGSARFFSPLSVDSFIKKMSYTCYTREALAELSSGIVTIAEKEGLGAHANSVKVRRDRKE